MVSSRIKNSIFASLLVILTTNCQPESATPPTSEVPSTSDRSQIIVLADISDEPAKTIERYQPLANYLANELNNIEIGQVEVAPDMNTMAEWLKTGKVDVYFDSPYPSMLVSDLSGAQPILRRWKNGVDAYHTIIFTQSDGVKTLDDLKGQIIAFEENFSTSGYMLPLAYFTESGIQLEEQLSVKASISSDRVGYVFSKGAENSIQWVLTERVAAAAVGAPDFQSIPADIRQQLTILGETEALPRHLVMVSPTLSPEAVEAIKAVLLEMDETASGQQVLASFEQTTKFDEFPEGLDRALNRMRQLYQLTKEQQN